jgi:Na+/melibiose symporter-like transporter
MGNGVELTAAQRWVIGISLASVTSMTSVLEGLVIFAYYNELDVTPADLSLSNFVVGLLGLCVSVVVGNLHDQMKDWKRIFMMVFSILYATALLLRYSAYFSSKTSAPAAAIYYVTCYSAEIIGRTGLSILQDTWIIESFDDQERRQLYPIVTAAGICGIILGLAIASLLPLDLIGLLISAMILITNSLITLRYYREPETVTVDESPTSPSTTQRSSKIPSVTTIASVFENSQYLICLFAMVFFWFYKSVPSLFVFFLADVMEVSQGRLSLVYVLGVLSYIVGGILAYPVTKYYTAVPHAETSSADAKHSLSRLALVGGAVGYGAVFLASYLHWALVVISLLLVGVANTAGSTIFKIFCADCVDYDLFLTKMKRPGAYVSVTNPLSTLIGIASVSLPLALMSLFGFEASHGGDDETSNNETMASTLVLRLWCGVIVGALCLVSYSFLRSYKVSSAPSSVLSLTSPIPPRPLSFTSPHPPRPLSFTSRDRWHCSSKDLGSNRSLLRETHLVLNSKHWLSSCRGNDGSKGFCSTHRVWRISS